MESKGPTEFFYGYVELRNSGLSVDMIDENAFGFDRPMGPVWKALSLASIAISGVHAWAVHRFNRRRDLLNATGTIVTVNNSYGIALAYLKMRGRLPSDVVFLAMGLTEMNPRPLVRMIYKRILPHVKLAAISRAEQQHLAAMFPRAKPHYVPFGVDHRFWIPGSRDQLGDYVLSVGNDPHRDYGTLVNAWKTEFPQLKIVTKLAVPEHTSKNIEIVAGDWTTQRLNDSELRTMVQCSRLVVIPVRETLQPSGQSACLQAMACGKAVILSDIAGLWDRKLMRSGENCILVPPGDTDALSQSIRSLLDDPDRAAMIGDAARSTVEQHFNVDIMTAAMETLCFDELPR
ncbi:MAG: glycosyltransferase family 4 protein [Alphaproteobacteria bacterium]|nr:glycosyltransferase family 4 protein [Alphaproteobacteria bacterium]